MSSRRHFRPHTTSSNWTGVRDPRAAVRFSLDERVAWDEGDRIVLATVEAFLEDECAIKVRLENGSSAIWPTVSARLRRVSLLDVVDATPPEIESPKFDSSNLEPIGERVNTLISGYYDTISFDEDEDNGNGEQEDSAILKHDTLYE